jgi:membrane-associated protein
LNSSFFIDILQQYGYLALWLIVFVASAGAPISGSLALFASGAFASLGDFNVFILFPTALSAAVMGDNLTYFIGFRVGAPILEWIGRQKRFRWMTPEAIERGRAYFRERTGLAIFITRFLLVVLGGPINLLAGTERYPYRKFLFWDASGQALGVIIPVGLGFIFAESWEEVAGVFGAFSSLVLTALIALILTVYLLRKIRQRRQARAKAEAVAGKESIAVPALSIETTVPMQAPMQQVMRTMDYDSGSLPVSD